MHKGMFYFDGFPFMHRVLDANSEIHNEKSWEVVSFVLSFKEIVLRIVWGKVLVESRNKQSVIKCNKTL